MKYLKTHESFDLYFRRKKLVQRIKSKLKKNNLDYINNPKIEHIIDNLNYAIDYDYTIIKIYLNSLNDLMFSIEMKYFKNEKEIFEQNIDKGICTNSDNPFNMVKGLKKVLKYLENLTPEEIEDIKIKQEAEKFNF